LNHGGGIKARVMLAQGVAVASAPLNVFGNDCLIHAHDDRISVACLAAVRSGVQPERREG
jgi:hypothetical protein